MGRADTYGMTTTQTFTYSDHFAAVNPIAAELERIAHRLRQGAISAELAQTKLEALAVTVGLIK